VPSDTRPEPDSFREYIARNYADWIGNDAALSSRMRWLPACKRPAMAVRWGLGVTAGSLTPKRYITDANELSGMTGPIGPELVRRLVERIDEHCDGQWSKLPDRFVKVPIFFALTNDDLMTLAAIENLDGLLAIDMSAQRFGVAGETRVTLTVKLIDVLARKVTWSSMPLSGQKARVTQGTADDASVEMITQVMSKIDEQYGLAPLPAINEAAAARRANKLSEAGGKSEQSLRSLLELRYYQSRKLLKADETRQAYQAIAGDKAAILAGDDGAARTAAVEEWFFKPKQAISSPAAAH
jgi:hypothetical protein